MTTVMLWDGSTTGHLVPSGAVSQQSYADVNASLRAASVFAKQTDYSDSTCLLDQKEDVERQGLIPDYLFGEPVAISSLPRDEVTSRRLRDLKPGMWVRLRNLHVEPPATEKFFTAPTPSSLSLTATDQATVTSSSTSSSSLHSSKSGLAAYVVGTVHTDTHISLLLPYFKCVIMTVMTIMTIMTIMTVMTVTTIFTTPIIILSYLRF